MITEHFKDLVIYFLEVLKIVIPVVWIGLGMRQFKKSGKTDILIFFLLFVCWVFFCNYVGVHRDPPAHVATLAEFMEKTDHTYHIMHITVDNKPYFELREQWSLPRLIVETVFIFQSGPPSCVFNQEGYMIDWTPDSAENPRYYTKWIKGPTDRKTVSFEEALELIEQWSKEQKKT